MEGDKAIDRCRYSYHNHQIRQFMAVACYDWEKLRLQSMRMLSKSKVCVLSQSIKSNLDVLDSIGDCHGYAFWGRPLVGVAGKD